MKLGRYVHPMVLQKRYAGIVKILIFRHEQDDLFEVDFLSRPERSRPEHTYLF